MLSRTINFLREGVEKGWHTGGQLYVSRGGEVVLDHAFGEARPGVEMTPETLMPWLSSGKPVTAVAIAQLFERGAVKLEEPVAAVIPEFGGEGKDGITPRHLLTHTAGLRLADKLSPELDWDEMIRCICETPLERDWTVGEKAGYSIGAGWFILGELVRRASGQPLDVYARERILQPAGMANVWPRLPFEQYRNYGERIGLLFEKDGAGWKPIALQDAAGMAVLRPGSSVRGPARELGAFYEMLLDGGKAPGGQILSPETIALFTQRHRTGLYDHTFFHTIDFGLGFIINSNRYGVETVPYGYGRHSSEETFGHGGAQSSGGFADPVHGLAVAWVMNGMPGIRAHHERGRELNSLVYQELGLA